MHDAYRSISPATAKYTNAEGAMMGLMQEYTSPRRSTIVWSVTLVPYVWYCSCHVLSRACKDSRAGDFAVRSRVMDAGCAAHCALPYVWYVWLVISFAHGMFGSTYTRPVTGLPAQSSSTNSYEGCHMNLGCE